MQQGFDHMKLGYVRVSTSEQDTRAQRPALLAAGRERVFGKAASFQSPAQCVGTSTSAGRMLMLGTFSEFERSMLRERTQAGRKAARAAGRHVGCPRALKDIQERESVAKPSAGAAAADAARLVGVNRSTISRLQSRIPRNEADETSLRR